MELRDGSTLGRLEGEIRFPEDHLVSKRHCRFRIVGNEIYVEDFGSTNKTKVNSVAIQPGKRRRIRLNDVIEIGSQRLILTHHTAAAPSHTQDLPRRNRGAYRVIRKNDGSLTLISKLITKRTQITVGWAKFQELRLRHRFAAHRARLRSFAAAFVVAVVGGAAFLWYSGLHHVGSR